MINHIDPRSPNTREPETAEDNPPGTLEEVAPDDPADKPGHEEQYEETPPSDRATVKGKAMLSFVLSNAEIIPDPTDPPMPDPMPDPEVPNPDSPEPLPLPSSAIIPEDPSTPDPNEDPSRPPPVEDPIDPLEPPIDEPDPVDPPVEEPPPGWGA